MASQHYRVSRNDKSYAANTAARKSHARQNHQGYTHEQTERMKTVQLTGGLSVQQAYTNQLSLPTEQFARKQDKRRDDVDNPLPQATRSVSTTFIAYPEGKRCWYVPVC